MPMYEYQCRDCGHNFEARQKFSDNPLTECPNCGAPTGLFRVVQATGIVFKGSGFYVNDSRGSKDSVNGSAKKKTDGAADSTPAAAPSGESTTSTPAEKPAASSEKAATTAAA